MPHKDPEKARKWRKEYRKRPEVKAKQKECYQRNKEKILIGQKRYYWENKEARLAYGKEYRRKKKKEIYIGCENCGIIFKSKRKRKYCLRKECFLDRMNKKVKERYHKNIAYQERQKRMQRLKHPQKKSIQYIKICKFCGNKFSYERIGKGKKKCSPLRKYCSDECRKESLKIMRRGYFHKRYKVDKDYTEKYREMSRKSHKKYHHKNKKEINQERRQHRKDNPKLYRLIDEKKSKRARKKLLKQNNLPEDYIREFKYEKIMKGILDQLFPNEFYIDNKFFIFSNGKIRLKHNAKKNSFQFDRYYPKIKVAFEFDGQQHHKFIPFFHENKEDFERSVERDRYKDKVCSIVGIKLLRIIFQELNIKLIKAKLDNLGIGYNNVQKKLPCRVVIGD